MAAAVGLSGLLLAGILQLGVPERVECAVRGGSQEALGGGPAGGGADCGGAGPRATKRVGASPAVPPSPSQAAATRAEVEGLADERPGLVQSVRVDQGTGVVLVSVAPGADPGQVASFTAQASQAGPVAVSGARKVVSEGSGLSTPRSLVGSQPQVEPLTGPRELSGGQAYYVDIGGENVGVCTLAFALRGAGGQAMYSSAGHCAEGNDELVLGPDGHLLGAPWTVLANGTDDSQSGLLNEVYYTPTGKIDTYGQVPGDVTITGQEPARVGEEVCVSGATTGFSCGEVLATDVTVEFDTDDGGFKEVSGMTEFVHCGLGGDSGGPVYTRGGQAQGIYKGGTSDGPDEKGDDSCQDEADEDDVSYFQPIADVLDANDAGLQLALAPADAP